MPKSLVQNIKLWIKRISSGDKQIDKIEQNVIIILGFIGAAIAEVIIADIFSFVDDSSLLLQLLVLSFFTLVFIFIAYIIIYIIKEFAPSISLSASNPVGDLVPRGANSAIVLSFDLFAIETNSKLESVGIMYTGNSPEDISDIFLVVDGGRISNSFNFKKTQLVHITIPDSLLILINKSVTIDVSVSFSAKSKISSQHSFQIKSKQYLITEGGELSGKFPLKSNTFTIAKESTGSLIFSSIKTNKNSLSSFRIQNDGEADQSLYAMTLKCLSHDDLDKIMNISLHHENGITLTNTVIHFINGYITLIFDAPFTLKSGDTVNMNLIATSNHSDIPVVLEIGSDLFAVSSLYGYGSNGQLYGSNVIILD